MKKLLNVLYVTSPDSYLSLEGETVSIKRGEEPAMRLPLHNLENIVCFGWMGASPALMNACSRNNIGLCFLTPNGRFMGRVVGRTQGNVLLRKKQYALSDIEKDSTPIAISFVLGKLSNSRTVLRRALRDHTLLVDREALSASSASLKEAMRAVQNCSTLEDLRGFEGSAAKVYFAVLDHLILQQKEDFSFSGRTRRPPTDSFNALLSFLYTLLTWDAASALETVGLDPYVGFLHRDRPGRPSLALDLMEELRPVFADRLALSLVNRRQITKSAFTQKESGGVLMDDEARKLVITAWQERKREEILHPFLKEKIEFGLVPYVQALLLARHLRGDLDAYPPFFWN